MKNLNSLPLYFIGTVRISLSGDYCERLLNIMAANSISFRNIRKKKNHFEITILKSDFKRLRLLKRKTGVKVKILSKNGLPFIVKKYKLRYGMAVGVLLFFLLLSFMSTRLWMIRVNGNEIVTEEQIISAVKALGVKEGISMQSIDVDVLKLKFVLSGKNIAWSSFNKQGCVLEVNVTEFDNRVSDDTPCNLVSGFDAVIKRIDVQSGSVKVKMGDTVAKGQLLVSGTVDFGTGSNFVASKGKIYAQVKENERVEIQKNYTSYSYTGKKISRKVINIMGIQLPLYLGKLHSEYDVTSSTHNINAFSGDIPISITTFNYNEKKPYSYVLTKDAAMEIIKSDITNKYEQSGREIIKISDESIIETEESIIYTGTVIFNTDIAVREEIIFFEE